jgi:PAS domain S-box-containing protein
LPAAVAVPVLLGWVRWRGQEAGLYGTSVGITLYTTSTVVILVLLVWRSAFHLGRADLERRRTAEEIKRLNQDLERRVEERTAELQVSESKFRGLLEMAPDAILTVNRDGRIVLANAHAEKLFGYRREELLGQSIELLVPERFQEKHRSQCETYFADPQARTMQAGAELWARRQDGSEFPAEMTLSALETDQGVLVTSIVRDLTERKRTEQEVNRLFTLALDLLCVAGFDGYFKRLNPTWEKTLGFTTAELLQKPYLDFVHPEDQAATRAQAEKLAQGAPVISFPNRYVCRDGSYRWLQWTAYPIPEEKLIYAAARDVTAQKEAEQRIRQVNAELAARTAELSVANEELAGANKELEAFTYSVSHDLRAPLRHIDGFSRLLLEEHSRELSDEARHYLERVRQGTRHMGNLVDDLLNLARVGRQELRRQVTGLGSLVEEVRRELEGELTGRAVEWRIGALPFVECDPRLMKQVFTNLLANAVKFTRPRKPAVIEVGGRTANGEPAIFVRDNGVGFSMKYADKLFGVFQRLHRPEDFEGTGVGLATVQRIIQKHGGQVWAEAELDKGATFHFTLGRREESEPEAAPARATRGEK